MTEKKTCDDLRVYRVGLYARLSVLDNGKEDGGSLESQIALMEQYVGERPYLQICKLYQDNGYTGTNFHRPAWDELLSDVAAGRIDCVIVKDLSRLGRNYIETGEFLEKDCPRLGLRFISINDGYDSASLNANEELTAALKNIVNDYYAKDISRKACSALAAKRARGDYLGSYAPYGYRKDPTNKNRLLVDPETSPVVRRIFEWRANGDGFGTINRRLNEQDIPSPGRYRFEHGVITNNNSKGAALLWNRHVLSDLLRNPVYIGRLEQGKCRASLYQGVPEHRVAKEEWVISEHTHEPIIDEELFFAVQRINEERADAYRSCHGKYDALPREQNPYGEKLICADCGARLTLHRALARGGKRGYYSYLCPTYEEHRELGCTRKSIRASALEEAVLAALRMQIQLFLSVSDVCAELTRKSAGKHQARAKSAIQTIEKQIARKNSVSVSLYADWKEGLLTRDEYLFAKERYASELAALRQQLAEAKLTGESADKSLSFAGDWARRLKEYVSAERVSRELADALIESVALDASGNLSIRFLFDDAKRQLDAELERLKGAAS